MAIVSYGYDGAVNEQAWAVLSTFVGRDYAAAGSGDWQVGAINGVDRGVAVAPGLIYGRGVCDVNDAPIVLQGAVVTSGSRWDTVVARRNWAGAGGSTTAVLVTGGTSQAIANGLNSQPGTLDDQPLALVRFAAGQLAPQEVIDLRDLPLDVVRTSSTSVDHKVSARDGLVRNALGQLLIRTGNTVQDALQRVASLLVTGSLTVGANASVGGTLNVKGAALAENHLTVLGNIDVANRLFVGPQFRDVEQHILDYYQKLYVEIPGSFNEVNQHFSHLEGSTIVDIYNRLNSLHVRLANHGI
jgi:hypothetical protein